MNAFVERLRMAIDTTIPFAIDGAPRKVIIADAADYQNVGDLAILLGQLDLIARLYPGARTSVASARTYNDGLDPEIESADVIFLQGGGNFGDIWREHHDFRLHLLTHFAHKPIIQFPQSIHFSDPSYLSRTQRVIEAAPEFTLNVRNTRSLDFARRNFACPVALCPDMAFSLGALDGGEATLDYACLLRTDKEVLEAKRGAVERILTESGATCASDDWLRNQHGLGWAVERVHGITTRLVKAGLSASLLARNAAPIFRLYAASRLRFGLAMLGRGRTVVTDRLHGFILATLIGRPRMVFDSYDGKIHAFHGTWLAEDPDARVLNSVAEFRDLIAALPSPPR